MYNVAVQIDDRETRVWYYTSKQNNGENILQNGESLIAMKHDGSCCEHFL